MDETRIKPEGENELTEAVVKALTAWMNQASITAAVRWPGQGAWERIVERIVLPVSSRLYRAGASVVTGEALERFLNGVRRRLVDESTLIEDIQHAQEQYGDDAVNVDWTGADGNSLPWRSRAALIGQHESQVTAMQAATDRAPQGARKRWEHVSDDRVRSAHRAAGGQVRPLDEPFNVGGAQLQYPGDPSGPAEQVLNCRCEMYLLTPTQGENMQSGLLAAAVTVDAEAPFAPRDTKWDGDDAKAKLRAWATDGGNLDAERMARGFLWADPSAAPSTWKLPVATVVDGRLTLVWAGIAAAAAAVQGARSPIDLPAGDVDKVKTALGKLYARAAKEFDDDSIQAPWLKQAERRATIMAQVAMIADEDDVETAAEAIEEARHHLTAASVRRHGGAWRPEASWFKPPQEADKTAMAAGEQPLVSDNGRILGYVATWKQPDGKPTLHLGYVDAGEYVAVPGQQNYGYFHQNNINYPLSDGTSAHVGIITDAGHPTDIDNPRHQAALVRVGEDDTGVWIAGAVFPDVLEDQMRFSRMKASAISGEWDLNTGTFRGAAMVNHPGFPQPTTRGQDFYALAASLSTPNVTEFAKAIESLVTAAPVLKEIAAAIDGRFNDRLFAADEPSQRVVKLKPESVKWLQQMREHHTMGIPMTREYLDRPETERDPAVTQLAETVIGQLTSQAGEMADMLKQAGDPAKPPAGEEKMEMSAADKPKLKPRRENDDSSDDRSDEPRNPEDAEERVEDEREREGTEPAGEDDDREPPVEDATSEDDRSDETEEDPDETPAQRRRRRMRAAYAQYKPDQAAERAPVQFLEAALDVIEDKDGLRAAVKAALPVHGVDLPLSLRILESFLNDTDELVSIQQARAASLKAAETLCRSSKPQHAAVRLQACRLLSEYRAKAGA